MGDHQHLDTEIEQLRESRQTLNSQISDLQSLIQYNEERLAEEDYEVLETLDVAEDPLADLDRATQQLTVQTEERRYGKKWSSSRGRR